MTKQFIHTYKPAMEITMVGFGQAGSRIVDVFAKYQTNGTQTYNCLAFNSNNGDLKGLTYIDPKNRVSLEIGGMGKNPEKAMKLLNSDENAIKIMNDFISKKIRTNDDLTIFFAGLGGGTGTATIVKAITDFHNYHNKPKIKAVLEAMIERYGREDYEKDKNNFHKKAFQIAEENFLKLGVVACLPLREDGSDVLRQVNEFAQEIWKLGNDVTKSVAFVCFPDNQFFLDEFDKLPAEEKKRLDNYRDYANEEIAQTIHEINVCANIGGTSVVLDSQDLKRAWTEHKGCLILSRQEVPINALQDSADITKLFSESLQKSNLHGKVNLIANNEAVSKVHHVGLLGIIDKSKESEKFGRGSFIDNAAEKVHDVLSISGSSTVFRGYVNEDNSNNVSVYSFYKAEVLPERLEKGLVKEYEQYIENDKKLKFAEVEIEKIQAHSTTDTDAFADLGIDLFEDEPKDKVEEKENSTKEKFADFDFSF
ncbi:cell division protein FtsZ [Lysinibacillus sp. NPDC096418]|uniref:cell division protein FtsZ n=1 Tax=Lysinibacillus sp. NPDC096418 TaxID=3364138 RepID=UPI003800CDF5